MAAPHSVDPAQLAEQLASASPDVLREMIAAMANALMSAQADQLCGAEYGERSPERTNRRNGYRAREWDTRAGTVELAVPKLRQGSYFPDWLLTHRRRAEQALVTVVATAYLLGVSTRRVERLAEQLGIKSLSRSQVSEMATHLDTQVTAFRDRPLDAGPYTFCWVDALTVKVREDGRVVNVHALIATGVNADGHREILGLDVASGEDGAGWLAFLRGLVARGLSGVQLVISDAHPGLVAAIGSALPGASWQRCRTHYLRNLLTRVPEVGAAARGHPGPHDLRPGRRRRRAAQFDRVVDALAIKYPDAAHIWRPLVTSCWRSPGSACIPSAGSPAPSVSPTRRGRRRSVAVRSGSGRSTSAHEAAMPAQDRVRGDQAWARSARGSRRMRAAKIARSAQSSVVSGWCGEARRLHAASRAARRPWWRTNDPAAGSARAPAGRSDTTAAATRR